MGRGHATIDNANGERCGRGLGWRRDIADVETGNIEKWQVWLRRPINHEDFRQIEQRP